MVAVPEFIAGRVVNDPWHVSHGSTNTLLSIVSIVNKMTFIR
jgi:hypothetical protein